MKNKNSNQQHSKWKRNHRNKVIFGILSCGLIMVGAGAGIGIGYSIWSKNNTPPNPTPTKEFQITVIKNTANGLLKEAGDEIILQAFPINGYDISWDGLSKIDGVKYDTSIATLLSIKATKNLDYHEDLHITATDGINVAYHVVDIYDLIENPIPLTSEYFVFDTTDNTNDTLMGFSEQVKQNPSILSAFNVLDFSNRTNIKYVGGSCKFNHQIFNEFQVQKIDLSNLIFLPNASGQSASTLFYGCNFSSCIQLNLFGVDFATIGTNRTAYYTFSYANLSGLAQLDLSNTMFAANNMTSGDVYTAYYTFSYANLSGLVQLDLSNTVFAANNMTSGDVYTAYYTFDATNLSGLDELDLSNTIFTISGMTTSESVFIAHYTFYAISLNDLSKIYLPNYDSSLPIWSSTFNNHTVDSAFIIYGYDSSWPTWFDSSWWAGATYQDVTP